VTSPAVNHSSPPPAMVASPLTCVGGSTSGLMHGSLVWAVHPDAINSSPRRQQRTLSSLGVGPQHPCSNSRQEQITGLISDMLVANMLLVSLVESPEFRTLLAFLEPVGRCGEVQRRISEILPSTRTVYIVCIVSTSHARSQTTRVNQTRR